MTLPPRRVGFRFSSTRASQFPSLRECSVWAVRFLSSRWNLVRNPSSGPRNFTANTSTWRRVAFSEILLAYVAPPPEVHNTSGSCGRPFVGLSRGGPHEVFQLRYLYDTYTTSPRASAKCVRIPTKYEARVSQQVRKIRPNHPRDTLRDPGPGSFSRVFVCIEPFLTDRAVFEKTIPSQGVLGCPRD